MTDKPQDIYGLVGYPLGHSFSRGFFNKKFAIEHINAVYRNFEIPSIDLFPAAVASTPHLVGLNVTIPYKQQVMRYLDAVDPVAEQIGAVNVIKVYTDAQGAAIKLVGYNSDVIGFVDSIRPMLKPRHKKALVLGSGGASNAVYHGLRSLGIEPVKVSRQSRPGMLTYADLSPEVMADHTVVVNTTPVGMYPNVDDCPDIPYDCLTDRHLCYDVVYNPELTRFLELSARQGASIKNGIEMLHGQAVAAWQIWQR